MTSLNLPGGLLAANAASYAKGQEVTRDASSDQKEKLRLARQIAANQKQAAELKKAEGAKKGFMA